MLRLNYIVVTVDFLYLFIKDKHRKAYKITMTTPGLHEMSQRVAAAVKFITSSKWRDVSVVNAEIINTVDVLGARIVSADNWTVYLIYDNDTQGGIPYPQGDFYAQDVRAV